MYAIRSYYARERRAEFRLFGAVIDAFCKRQRDQFFLAVRHTSPLEAGGTNRATDALDLCTPVKRVLVEPRLVRLALAGIVRVGILLTVR